MVIKIGMVKVLTCNLQCHQPIGYNICAFFAHISCSMVPKWLKLDQIVEKLQLMAAMGINSFKVSVLLLPNV